MDKSPEAFRTISEVAETLDVPPHVLRFWESRFAQVKPVKRGGGRRYYRPEDVRLLRGIRGLLYDDGMTIKGVQKILRERGARHVIGLGTLPEAAAPAPAAPRPITSPEAPRPITSPEAPPPIASRDALPPVAAPRATARNGAAEPAPPAPQADLFAASAPQAASAAAVVERARIAPSGRVALRALVDELESLRAAMSADPKR